MYDGCFALEKFENFKRNFLDFAKTVVTWFFH